MGMTRLERVLLRKKQETQQIRNGVPSVADLREGVPEIRKTPDGVVEYIKVNNVLYKKILDKV